MAPSLRRSPHSIFAQSRWAPGRLCVPEELELSELVLVVVTPPVGISDEAVLWNVDAAVVSPNCELVVPEFVSVGLVPDNPDVPKPKSLFLPRPQPKVISVDNPKLVK